jgi:transcriptional regulator with XRE-family HTH domain
MNWHEDNYERGWRKDQGRAEHPDHEDVDPPDFEFTVDENGDLVDPHEERARERGQDCAEDLGLQGCTFIGRDEEDTTLCQALGIILLRKVYDTFLSPEQIQDLHPSITPDTSQHYARDLSIQLIQITMNERYGVVVGDHRNDITQILHGTAMGTHEALTFLCEAVEEVPESVLLQAQVLSPYEVEAILADNPSENSNFPVLCNPVGFHTRSQLLADTESTATIQALGRLLTTMLYREFVSPSEIQQLREKLPPQMSSGTAYELSMTLLRERLCAEQRGPRIDHGALTQVFGGTRMAQAHALEAICRALDVDKDQILRAAREDSQGQDPE